jgi:hypothetical protein
MTKPKTLEDFPRLVVENVTRGVTAADGYTRFELRGRFDRIIDEKEQEWFYALFGTRDSVCVTLQSLEKGTRATVLTCDEKDDPNLLGQSLTHLGRRWQPYKIWMVVEPNWRWERQTFPGIDAVAEDYEAKDVSIVDGREVKVWTKLEPVRSGEGLSRYYPASDQAVPSGSTSRFVPLGWDHEHCELCNAHIDAGHSGYCDPDEHWLCEQCYERFVVPHDLAFVDEM